MATTESSRSIRTIGLLVVFLFLIPVFLMLAMMPMMGMMGSGAYHMDMTGTSPLWMAGMMAIRIILVAGLLYVAYRFLTGGTVHSEDPAFEELRLAYARGDLSEEEYEKRREKLGQNQ